MPVVVLGRNLVENDDDLIQRCRRDPGAFRALVERHQGRIYGFLVRLAGRGRADDLFQEVWLKVLKHSDGYVSQGKAVSWSCPFSRAGRWCGCFSPENC